MSYVQSLREAMSLVATKAPNPVFVGQAVRHAGTFMRRTLDHLPPEFLVEFPVAENLQLGVCTGLALVGHTPVAIFPRINFMMEAMSQLVSHLDKLPLMGAGSPKVLIRTAVCLPSSTMDPGPQHVGNYVPALKQMLSTITVSVLDNAKKVVPAYRDALTRDGSTILVEFLGAYDE